MTPDDPRHGTPAGAVQHWRDGEKPCPPCSKAASAARKRRELDALSGRSRTVELGEEAWRIVHTAQRVEISEVTGWTAERVGRYDKGGPTMHVHRKTRDAILAYRPQWTRVGIHRRVRALSRLGWSIAVQSEHCGVSRRRLYQIQTSVTDFKSTDVPNRIVAMYDELSMLVPPTGCSSKQARDQAAAKGYLPPLVWDDIDDPDERPQVGTDPRWRSKDDVDHARVERAINGERLHLTRAERVEVVRRLRDIRGWSEERIEAHTGITQACNRHRYPRPDQEDAA